MCDCDLINREFYSHTTPKARKQHKCSECSSTIEKGETYHLHSGKWDGDISSYKICNFCQEVADQLVDCFCFGELYEELRNSDLIHWNGDFSLDPRLEAVSTNPLRVKLRKLAEVVT